MSPVSRYFCPVKQVIVTLGGDTVSACREAFMETVWVLVGLCW